MKWSLYIGKISGIKLFVHWTFLILIFWVIFSEATRGSDAREILLSLGFIAAIFACIILHELGHALTAKRFHFKTHDITLLPIGGLARMEGLPDKPMHEFLVAIMGPAVNLAIGFILFLFLRLSDMYAGSIYNLTESNFWFQLYAVNIFLALFNLIPAFPMDGGRILRALLSIRLSRVKATRIAAYIGQLLAIVFVLIGFLYNPILAFIGLFVFLGAQAEASGEEAKVILSNIRVRDLAMRHYSTLHPKEPLSKAVSLMLDSQEKSFIVKDNGDVRGILSEKGIIEGLSKFGKDISVEKVMETKITSLHEQDNVNQVIQKFSDGTHSLMPVFEGNQITGVLNLENIHEFVQIQSALKKAEKSET